MSAYAWILLLEGLGGLLDRVGLLSVKPVRQILYILNKMWQTAENAPAECARVCWMVQAVLDVMITFESIKGIETIYGGRHTQQGTSFQ